MGDAEVDKRAPQQALVDTVSQILMQEDVLADAAPQVALRLIEHLPAECVCIFFRRRTDKELCRVALAVNDGGLFTNLHANDAFLWDRSYPRGSQTLLYETYRGEKSFINYDYDKLRGKGVNAAIVRQFEKCLPSQRFQHLIIVRIYIGDKQLGAIRVINHLDRTRNFEISKEAVFPSSDVRDVLCISAMLALAFANRRKTEKISATREYAKRMDACASEKEAIGKCLENLASEEYGFPLAMWREIDGNGKSWTTMHHPKSISLSPPELPHDPDSEFQLGEDPIVVEIDEHNCVYYGWATENDLRAYYRRKVSYPGKKNELAVFADSVAEFDSPSKTLIEINVGILESTLRSLRAPRSIIGRSTVIKSLITQVERLARNDFPVLILGDTGSGKEHIAKAIQDASQRSGDFVPVHCAAFSPELLRSTLFGQAGAGIEPQKGAFQKADGGTIFLDEIGDMPQELQAALQRVLKDKVIVPAGSTVDIPVNVRVIAASNTNLKEKMDAGEFRKELYSRFIDGVVNVPPLSEHREDIRALAEHFLSIGSQANMHDEEVRGFDEQAIVALEGHDWLGNARQLQTTIQRAVHLARGTTLTLADVFPENAGNGADDRRSGDQFFTMKEFEEKCVRRAFQRCATMQEVGEKLDIGPKKVRGYSKEYKLRPSGRSGPRPTKTTKEFLSDAMRAYAHEVFDSVMSKKETARILGISSRTISRWFSADH